jgi:hypothetical protein
MLSIVPICQPESVSQLGIDKEPLSETFHNIHIARILQQRIVEYKTKVEIGIPQLLGD